MVKIFERLEANSKALSAWIAEADLADWPFPSDEELLKENFKRWLAWKEMKEIMLDEESIQVGAEILKMMSIIGLKPDFSIEKVDTHFEQGESNGK